MRLPGGERAIVPREKIVHYLLAPEHPEGGGKARFFLKRGYHASRPEELALALYAIASYGQLKETMETRYGSKYVVDGVVRTPDGRDARLRTIWFVPSGARLPRLVTAYPR